MLKIDVSGFKDVQQSLERLEKQVRFASAVALTRTAKAVQTRIEQEIDRTFDRPKAFTRRAAGIDPATASRLEARVFLRDRQAAYLLPHIRGGRRSSKAFEQRFDTPAALPTRSTPLDSYGNVTRATIKRLARDAAKRRGKVFIVREGSHLPPGVYERVGRRGLKLLLAFERSLPAYRSRFRFYEVAIAEAHRAFPGEFDRALRGALASAR
jgi:hypothetical protein